MPRPQRSSGSRDRSPRGRDRGSRDGRGRSRDREEPQGDFDDFRRSRGGRDQGRMNQRVRDSDRRSRKSEYKEEFDINCAECGKRSKVPFKPTGSKPVLCSDCFRKVEKKGPPELQDIHKKLDKIMKALDIK